MLVARSADLRDFGVLEHLHRLYQPYTFNPKMEDSSKN
jgi:hypothetical protein